MPSKNIVPALIPALLAVMIVAVPSSATVAVPTVQSSTFTVGSAPTGIAISPDGSKAYVASYSGNNVSVINLATGLVDRTITVGRTPTSIAIHPSGAFAYVVNYNDPGDASRPSSISRIELETGTVSATITDASFSGSVNVIFSLDGSKAYVTNRGVVDTLGNKISVITTATNQVTETITTQQGRTINIAISSDGNRLYVSHLTGHVSSIDISSSPAVVTPLISGLTSPQGLALVGNPGSQKLYVAEKGNADRISVYNAQTGAPIRQIAGFSDPESMTLNGSQPNATQLFVANRGANNVLIIDLATDQIVAPTLTVSNAPFEIAFAPNGLKAYVTNNGTSNPGRVSVISYHQTRTLSFATTSYTLSYGATQAVTATPSAGSGVGTISYSHGSSTACTVNSSTGLVTVTAATGTCSISASITEGGSTTSTAFQAASTTTPVTITPQPASLGINAATQTINVGANFSPSFSVTSGNLVSPDAISALTYTYEGTGSTNYPASTTAPTAIGTYSISPSAAVFSTGSASRYNISYSLGSLVIQAQPTAITIAAQSQTVESGASVTTQFLISSGTLIGSDNISGVTFTFQGIGSTNYPASTTIPTSPGTYSTTPSNAIFSSGSSASYTITYAPGTLTVSAPTPSSPTPTPSSPTPTPSSPTTSLSALPKTGAPPESLFIGLASAVMMGLGLVAVIASRRTKKI
jgi:YVTN family beta-propeller protein